jgi:hypothetical protein
MWTAWRWMILIALMTLLAGFTPEQAAAAGLKAPARQGTTLALVSPTACPSGGCAAGQRMNLRFDFELSIYSPTTDPNIKVCFYAPNTWNLVVDAPDTLTGELTGKTYNKITGLPNNCSEDTAQPTGYALIAAYSAFINETTFSDSVPLVFRFRSDATGSGRVVARLFENSGSGFSRTQQSTTATLSIAARSASAYTASDAATCGSNSPCYLNSADDLDNGVGTGLRDAVEASPDGATIYILGSYKVKSKAVAIDRQMTISGINNSSISNPGVTSCSQPMLSLRGAVTLSNLIITDGTCPSPGRTLVEVNSDENVVIQSNDLTNGDNAIFIQDKAGAVTILFNNITGNTGYAVYVAGQVAGGALNVIANNLNGNRSGAAIECSGTASAVVTNRKANHNYWGTSAPSSDTTHCNMTSGKRLGLAIAEKSSASGVNAQLVTVPDTKKYAFDNQIAFRHNGGADFPLYIIDHGYMPGSSAPFTTAAGGDSPSPCSDYWDVFLPDGVTPSGTLELSFKYDKTSACMAAINSNQYCDQTATPGKYPLYWYDPATNATKWWDPTGARPENLSSGDGQSTTCNISSSEIQVALDSSGRPNLTGDLNYTPFMVGVPILKSFLPLASSQNITVTWTTNNEPDVSGFYVLRSLDGVNFSPISDLISRRGSALVGVTYPAYSFVDSGRVNGVTYYYRLQVVRTDSKSFYSSVYSIAANIATITPTFTIAPTLTPRPTSTPIPTRIPVRFPTPVPTRTFTRIPGGPTSTAFIFKTPTPFGADTATIDPNSTLDPTLESIILTQEANPATSETAILTAPAQETATTSPQGTEIAFLATGTLAPTPSETIFPEATQEVTGPSWPSLIIGLLVGLAVTGGIGGWGDLNNRR